MNRFQYCRCYCLILHVLLTFSLVCTLTGSNLKRETNRPPKKEATLLRNQSTRLEKALPKSFRLLGEQRKREEDGGGGSEGVIVVSDDSDEEEKTEGEGVIGRNDLA